MKKEKRTEKGRKDYHPFSKIKERELIIRGAARGVAMLALCCITFVVIPSAFGFEDYITGESAIQGEVMENDSPAKGESGFYYDVPASESNEEDKIRDKETVTQEENQETGQSSDDEEQTEIK